MFLKLKNDLWVQKTLTELENFPSGLLLYCTIAFDFIKTYVKNNCHHLLAL